MMPTPSSEYDEFVLPVTQPYDPAWLFGFHGRRALTGIETVAGLQYQRRLGSGELWLRVAWHAGGLRVQVPVAAELGRSRTLTTVRRMFDVDCDPSAVATTLEADERLRGLVRQAPGLRVPGVWDGFETAVRAILGQQVSVARATALADRLIARYGAGQFPGPERLVGVNPAEIGMPGRRGQAIARLADAVLNQNINFDGTIGCAQLTDELLAIPGIGAWTAGYIAMRVARDPDAFLETDWVVRKQLALTPAAARQLAESWRPWRSYAVMYLWWAAGAGVTY